MLQALLGDGYCVRNFGAEGRTATEGLSDARFFDRSYHATPMYRESIEMNTDTVVICLGTNDVRLCQLHTENGKQNYLSGIRHLISTYRNAGAKRIYIGLPPHGLLSPCNRNGELLLPLVEQVAREYDIETIDFYTPTFQNTSLIDTDMLHLTAQGYQIMANLVYDKMMADGQ